jgi:hypothetical protein
MAVINLINGSTNLPSSDPTVTLYSGAYRGDILYLGDAGNIVGTTEPPTPEIKVYRGRVGPSYVFASGSPPEGATDIVIVGVL